MWGCFGSRGVGQLGGRVCTRLARRRTGSVPHGDGSQSRSTQSRVHERAWPRSRAGVHVGRLVRLARSIRELVGLGDV
jgi:hypothetical protein